MWENVARRLEGSLVVLEPLEPRHERGLFEAAQDPRIWRYIPFDAGGGRMEDTRVAVEAYPAVVARRFLARVSYKNDERRKQTMAQRAAREKLLAGLESDTLKEAYGFVVEMELSWREELVRDPAADALDSLLCAVQAAWAYTKRDENYGGTP